MTLITVVLVGALGVGGVACTPAPTKRPVADGGRAPAEPTDTSDLEKALVDFLRRGIEKRRRDRTARGVLPAACPSPMVEWSELQVSDVRVTPQIASGEAQLVAIARPSKLVPKDERSCAAKIAFRLRSDGTDLGPRKWKVRSVWLSEQAEPLDPTDVDGDGDADADDVDANAED